MGGDLLADAVCDRHREFFGHGSEPVLPLRILTKDELSKDHTDGSFVLARRLLQIFGAVRFVLGKEDVAVGSVGREPGDEGVRLFGGPNYGEFVGLGGLGRWGSNNSGFLLNMALLACTTPGSSTMAPGWVGGGYRGSWVAAVGVISVH